MLADKKSKCSTLHQSDSQYDSSSSKISKDSSHGGIRLKRFEQLKKLQGKGYSIRAMVWHLCMHRQTIKNYLNMETLPRKSQSQVNPMEKFFTYIKKRMEEEPGIFLTTLWQELKSQGYAVAYSTLSEALKFYGIRVGKKAGGTKKLPNRGAGSFKPSTAAMWFISPQQNLGDDQRKILQKLCTSCKDLHKTFSLVQSFRKMMTERSGNTELRKWIKKSSKSEVKEIASFAKGLVSGLPRC